MKSIVKWFVNNPVATNLIMIVILIGGIMGYQSVGKIAFPTFPLNEIRVSVNYLGAGPREVEERVLVRVEEAVFDLQGIKRLYSRAREGNGMVRIEVEDGYDPDKMLNEVKARVDAINTLPALSERPIVERDYAQSDVINLVVYGDIGEKELKELGRDIRDKIATIPGAAKTQLDAVRDYEISIEVSELDLQKYGLTFDDVSNAIARSSVNMPAGKVDNESGQIQIMTRGQAYVQEDFENIVVLRNEDGTRVLLKDVARVVDGFTDDQFRIGFNGKPGVLLFVRTEGTPDVVQLSKQINKMIEEEIRPTLPEGVQMDNWFDTSDFFNSRLSMLLWNGISGLILVFVCLMIFLNVELSFWVTAGIAISFLGCLMLLPSTGVSLTMISLFAFILILGIVVDDAIIIGESIHRENQHGVIGGEGAIVGTEKVAKPVIFSALTTMIAFLPLAFLPGNSGKVTYVIPVVVILCLCFSLLESLLILPTHLRHGGEKGTGFLSKVANLSLIRNVLDNMSKLFTRIQDKASQFLNWFVYSWYRPFLDKVLHRAGLSLCIILAGSMIVFSLNIAGWVKNTFMPDVPMDFVQARIDFPAGSPYDTIDQATHILEDAALKLKDELAQEYPDQKVIKDVLTWTSNRSGSARAFLILVPAEERDVNVVQITERWRDMTPVIPDAKNVNFDFSGQGSSGPTIDLLIKSRNPEQIEQAALALKDVYRGYNGLYNVTDSGDTARMEAVLNLKPSAENLGLSLADIARQVRQAFYGDEVQRIPRGPDDVKVMVRLPKEDRTSFDTMNDLYVRTPGGEEVPFGAAADISYRQAYTTIERTDRMRTLEVMANVDPDVANASEILKDIEEKYFPEWKKKFPDVEFSLEGDQREEQEFMQSLASGFGIALLAIYFLMAVAFKSYIQPFLIFTAIPFGYMGAILGHLALGMDLSIYSILGIVAAAGVVINDNLVLLDYIHKLRDRGHDALRAIEIAAEERFRPIFLTSLTTFIGLVPMMMETSVQAKFLVPTVVSLAFGVALSSIATLFLVPILYLMVARTREKLSFLLGHKEPSVIVGE
ncbi:efflux RND transporter permease subunit [Emcibacter nanhaiensis]|uniref:Efflux RND transporter permease subunit n=1 Tax=Emcibacter nanhaiensis TaxID=1505037 RepID=A0A501PMM9_9PROT|nr:efflux RND transporter permease subunit [Emcibacter nanhaiensis]TPD61703.1 efflux RND transporter permease subunit [Emcibacter nanhaiensis]